MADANLIAARLRYAINLRGTTQAALLPMLNERVESLLPGAPKFTPFTLSRTTTGKRSVKDYELVAIASVLDVPITWLVGQARLETLAEAIWGTT